MGTKTAALLSGIVLAGLCGWLSPAAGQTARSFEDLRKSLRYASRTKIVTALPYGTALSDVESIMGKETRDSKQWWEGFRIRHYVTSGTNSKYFTLCFKKRRLIAKSKNECKYVNKLFEGRESIRTEMEYIENYYDSKSPAIDMAKIRSSSSLVGAYNFGGVRLGQALSRAEFPDCPVDRNYFRKRIKEYARRCRLEFAPGTSARLYNLPKFGDTGITLVELENGAVTQLAYMSHSYNSKTFSSRVKKRLNREIGEPAYYEEIHVGDNRGRVRLKYMAYWDAGDSLIYLTNFGHISGRAIMIVSR